MTRAALYAQALSAVVSEGTLSEKQAWEGFTALLKRKGHLSLLPLIGKELERLGVRHKKQGALVTLGKEEDSKTYAKEIQKVLKEVGSKERSEVVIDERLIGGFRVEANNKLTDRSHRKSLLELYRRLTQV